MKLTVGSLQNDLEQIRDLLDRGSFFSITVEEKESLQTETTNLSEKLASIQAGYFTVGLLGGTGVGKSSLMNALARSDIASADHRRPHTDQALVYRYAETNVPPGLFQADLPWREITHEVKEIRQVFLCDMPDFDSLLGEHRDYVLNFLEYLDVLVWVTSPEKYGDGRFYEFLQMVPKAKRNFYYVLNKADLLFQGQALEKGYAQLESVTAQFQQHLKENGIENPFVYALSSQESLDSGTLSPWNHLPAFRHAVFQQRNLKQIAAIKTSNLDVEVQRLYVAFGKEIRNLKRFSQLLENSIEALEKHRPEWIKAGQGAIDLWLERYIKQNICSPQNDPSPLVGPGHSLALLLHGWKGKGATYENPQTDVAVFTPPEHVRATFRGRLEWLEDQVNHRILRQNLPASFRRRVQQILEVPKSFDGLGQQFFDAVALRVTSPPLPSFWGFKIRQYLTSSLLLIFLLVALGGKTAWQEILATPQSARILNLLFSTIYALFSTKGLAALVSYGLLNLFFAFRFYRRHRHLLQKVTEKIIASLKADLGSVWEDKLNAILADLTQLRADIQSQIAALSVMKK